MDEFDGQQQTQQPLSQQNPQPQAGPPLPENTPDPFASFQSRMSLEKKRRDLFTVIGATAGTLLLLCLTVLLLLQFGQTKTYKSEASHYETILATTQKNEQKLETDNNNLSSSNSQLNQSVSSAQQQTAAANASLTQAQAQLNTINSQLSAKQATLAKAERGVAKFSDLQTWFNAYDSDASKCLDLIEQLDSETDQTSFNNDLSQLEQYDNSLTVDYNNITDIFSEIKSGNY